ncbi:MAG TPA: hypothetical protein VGK26_09320 [Thermoanaerobaculia bacterium]|jgi:hypothetical protein
MDAKRSAPSADRFARRLGLRALWPLLALAAILLGTIAVGTWKGYPVADDGYMTILLRTGPHKVAAANPDRPINAWLLDIWAGDGSNIVPSILLDLFLWSALAWQTGLLWRRLFPESARYWPLAAILCVAPLAVETQFTTLTTLMPANLPVCVALGALLLLLREEPPSTGVSVAAGVAAALAVAISEYGLVMAAGTITLLVFLGRLRRILPLAAGAAVGYGVFRAIADVTARDEGKLAVQGTKLFATPWAIPPRLGTGLWYSIVGAYGRAADQLRPEWSSRSTIVALGVALVVAALAVWSCRGPRDGAETEARLGLRRPLALLAATTVALAGVMSQNTFLVLTGYESRLRLPALPFAALLILCGIRGLLPRYRMIAVGLLGLLAGYTTVVVSIGTIREQRVLAQVGEIVRNRLGPEGTTTIAVVPPFGGRLDDVELTAKATRGWSTAEANRAWFIHSAGALVDYGDRMRCKPVGSFSVQNERFARPTTRLCRIFYVPVSPDGKIGELEPYCIEATRTWGVTSGCDRSF